MIFLGLLTLLLLNFVSIISSVCPKVSIEPCSCSIEHDTRESKINCNSNESTLDLDKVIQLIENNLDKSELHFSWFGSYDSLLTELKENAFKSITFDGFLIKNCKKFKSIDENAFQGTDQAITSIYIEDNPVLLFRNNSLYKILNKLSRLNWITLKNINSVYEVPTDAFNHLAQLETLTLAGTSFEKLQARAFYSLRKLRSISFENTNFNTIPDFAFEFQQDSNLILEISFKESLIPEQYFSNNSFSNIRRPTNLRFSSGTNLKYLKQSTI